MKKSFFPALLLFLVLVSCGEQQDFPEIVMEPTPIMTGTTSWGVVNVSYLKINKEPDNDEHIITTLRKGDLVRIETAHYINRNGASTLWYFISKDKLKGWVQDSSLNSYSTREQALTASDTLLNGSR